MAGLALALEDVVFRASVALRSDFAPDLPPRAGSCSPNLGLQTDPADAEPVPAPPPAGRGPCTLLLQNLPLRGRIIQVFDHLDSLGFSGAYDYVHLPIDKRTRMLKGFGFVNFTDPADAQRCLDCIAQTQLAGSKSKRTLTAAIGAQQGIDANLATLPECSKKSRRRDAEYPWIRVDGEMMPIQETERRLLPK